MPMMNKSSSSLCLLLLLVCAAAAAAASAVTATAVEKRTLVLLESASLRDSHSELLASLRGRGHELEIRSLYSSTVRLDEHGEWLFGNVLILSEAAEALPNHIGTSKLIEFMDAGHNVLAVGGSKMPEKSALRQFANECGVEFDKRGSQVVDHMHFDARLDRVTGLHTAVTSARVSRAVFGADFGGSVVSRGVGLSVKDDSALVRELLTAESSAYSFAADAAVTKYPESTGTDTVLVAAVQTNENARAVFVGSLEMLGNEFLAAPGHKNREFATLATQWAFKERQVLRWRELKHHNRDNPSFVNPPSYRINDQLHFSIVIEQLDAESGEWVPYVADNVQLEFVMLDPYYRVVLDHDGSGLYSTKFQIPDVFGVYKFRINYDQPGFTNIFFEQQVNVRPFRHNEFERFLPCAFPYYAGAFSMMGGFFVFGVVFLYQAQGDHKKRD